MTIRGACFAVIALLSASSLRAGPYSDLIVFGDSLSDVGNTSFWTAGAFPGSNYFNGRFSNGPTYAERLSEGLGFGELVRDGRGGDNFAYGGAETNGPGGFSGVLINSLVEQVDAYFDRLDGTPLDSEALYVVFIGANDFLLAGETDVTVPASVVQSQLGRLAAAGARDVLGINLPRLGVTPRFLSNADEWTTRSEAYNAELAAAYDAVEAANSELTIHRLDVEGLFAEILDDASSLGFTNTTQAGRDASGGSLEGAPGYVFWDDVHPTRETHALLGEAALRTVLPVGDYDRDGLVTPSDGEAWRAAYGTVFDASLGQTPNLAADGNGDGRIDAADFTVWRDAYRLNGSLRVPEPSAFLAMVLACALSIAGGRVRRFVA